MKHIASCSFGKDSIATVLLALRHREPLDEVVYCEVMFDKEISGEVPEHRDFIYSKAIPVLKSMGVNVSVLRSEKTYVSVFTGRITRGPKKGMIRSFPICGRCAIQRDCKIKPIRQYQKTLPHREPNRSPAERVRVGEEGQGSERSFRRKAETELSGLCPDVVQYIGIAKDEQERLLRLNGHQSSLLDKYGYEEQDAKELCQSAGLLSPVYEFTGRGGCWFCPNAKRIRGPHRNPAKRFRWGEEEQESERSFRHKAETEMSGLCDDERHLYDHHPELWARMMELQAIPGKVSKKFNRTERFDHIDAEFRLQDAQESLFRQAA